MSIELRNTRALCAGLGGLVVLLSACSSQKAPTPSSTVAASAPALPAPQLWGDLKPVVTVKELMRDLIDPLADNIFDAVSTVSNPKGTEEKVPKTDEDWDKLRIGAVTLVEGANLLKIARPFAPPGAADDSSGPDATELSTAQITAKRNADPIEWNARVEALRNVGLEVMDIIKRKDVKELWDASDNLDTACENCHRSFWYPKEDAQFYQKLDSRLKELHKSSNGGR
jgi:hypothetical protein